APELRGWVASNAQTLVPAPSLTYGAAQASEALFVTLFVIGAATPGAEAHSLSPDTLEGHILWRQGASLRTLTLARDAEGRIKTQLLLDDVTAFADHLPPAGD
ncbi:MAG: hypothetical protein ACRED4_04640, partial [Brevundimonas sp.]